MQSLLVPLIGGVAEHEALVAGTHFRFVLGFVNGGGNISVLPMHIHNYFALVCIKTHFFTGESHIFTHFPCNFLKIDLLLINADFSEEDNLYMSGINLMN